LDIFCNKYDYVYELNGKGIKLDGGIYKEGVLTGYAAIKGRQHTQWNKHEELLPISKERYETILKVEEEMPVCMIFAFDANKSDTEEVCLTIPNVLYIAWAMAKQFRGELRQVDESDEECFFVDKGCLGFAKKPDEWRAKDEHGNVIGGKSGNTLTLCHALKEQLDMYAKDEVEQIKVVKRFKGDIAKAVQHLRGKHMKKYAKN